MAAWDLSRIVLTQSGGLKAMFTDGAVLVLSDDGQVTTVSHGAIIIHLALAQACDFPDESSIIHADTRRQFRLSAADEVPAQQAPTSSCARPGVSQSAP